MKKAVKKADLQKDGFILNQNFDIVPIIKYEPVHVAPRDINRNVITVYRGNYKVEGLYVTDDFKEQVEYREQSVFFRPSGFIGKRYSLHLKML